MKTIAVLCSIAGVICIALAFSCDSLIESRLFIGLSVVSGLLFFRFASMPAPSAVQRKKEQEPVRAYASQEAQVEHMRHIIQQ